MPEKSKTTETIQKSPRQKREDWDNQQAREALCGKLVYLVLRRVPNHVSESDMLSQAYLGWVEARNKFDATRDVNFETYATPIIRGRILDGFREWDNGTRVQRKYEKKRVRFEADFVSSHGRQPTESEILDGLGWDSQRLYSSRVGTQVANEYRDSHGRPQSILSFSPDPKQMSPVRRAAEDRFLRSVTRCLSIRVLVMVYLWLYLDLPMRKIGQLFDLSESRVSQEIKKGFDEVRRNRDEVLDEFNEMKRAA